MSRFETAAANPFFGVTRSVVGREIRMGDTVSFMSEADLSEVETIRRNSCSVKPSYTAFVVKDIAVKPRRR